jgi:putative membrane protein
MPLPDREHPTFAGDPRVYFAAERTLLAWLRTGIAIMAFGFVVARFGLFLRLLRAEASAVPGHGVSPYIGAGLVVLGVIASAIGAAHFRHFCKQLGPEELPSRQAALFPLLLAWSLVAMGGALAIILLG